MNREIKFRLYFHDKELSRLQYSTHKFEVTDKQLHVMLARFDENTIKGFVQFTGMKDKNGIDIYEGDVIRLTYKHSSPKYNDTKEDFMVTYESDKARFMLSDGTAWWSFDKTNVMEVIGNIYSNPELVSSSEIPTEKRE